MRILWWLIGAAALVGGVVKVLGFVRMVDKRQPPRAGKDGTEARP